ncbi:hypothetical protein MNBD_BACTEROID07-190 [hydrothermal vent metagenome]|uniref:TolB protein, periplasmic protein involved in the tonb-independent uptake of group A colicins n=1 Tax=hydrothermal vent metagenome TaxID=652676 RepID=A0A3B0UGL2_9ZZZZ
MKKPWLLPVIILLTLLLFSGQAKAQYYLTGQDPASVKWRQIKTKEFRLVFPKGYEKIANYYMNLLQLSAPSINTPYHAHLRRLNIVLHNQSTTSNAMVSPAPFHADFFEMPSQDIYAQKWQKQLTLHEFRHAVQMDKMRQGFGNFMYYLLGDQGTAAIFGLYLPMWFIEGDAVWSETVHSNSGRGRLPDFVYPLKAQVLGKEIYKYDKAQFGSYRDFVPDHYTLGYQLISEGVKNYGTGLWNDVLNQVARKGYTFVPFTHRLKKNTGNKKVKYYQTTMSALKSQWQAQVKPPENHNTHIVSDRFYTSYLFPRILSNGSIIAEQTSIDDINRFVKIDPDGKVTRLFTPGFDFKESLSANDSLICWNEKTFDPRWSNRDYSVIKIYNYKTRKLRQLTSRSRYFAPELSPDGKTIIAVRVDLQQNYYLDFLDVATGKKLKEFRTPNNLFFMTPHWSADGKNVVTTVLGDKGKSILLLNTKTMKYRLLLPFSFTEIKWPVMYGNRVVYTGTYEGKDNLYAIDVATGKAYRVFNSRFGAITPVFAPGGKKLYFSNYTADGYKTASLTLAPSDLKLFKVTTTHHEYLVDKLRGKNTFNLDDSIVPKKKYPEKKYSRLGHLFNPHSWAPLALDLNSYTIKPGVMLLSQNVLSTAITMLGWSYDLNERTGKFNFGMRYLGWYPVIGINVTYGNRRAYMADNSGTSHELFWHETNLSLNVSVPLDFTHSKWINGLRPYIAFSEKFLKMGAGYPYKFKEDRVMTMHYQIYAYNQLKQSAKDIYPKWGQNIQIDYENTPIADDPGNQFAVQGHLYFPGFVRHQSVVLYAGYDRQQRGNYSFSTIVDIPRGYSNIYEDKMMVFKADYVFPIAYPDMDWQGVMYLKRIYGHAFYDFLKGETSGIVSDYASTGLELYTDWNFLSFFPNISVGLRWSYAINRKAQTFDFLFGINF